jgi:superfamily I DNA and/or RNA helicase
MDYFKKQLELLSIEREEDRLNYQLLTKSTSVSERRANGLAWYPIAIRGTELGRGEYLTVELERTTHHDISHQLRSGMPAVLFSNHNPQEDRMEGTISFQNSNRLKIALRTDELPDWSRDGKLGIELLFDDNSYDEMIAALKAARVLGADTAAGRLVRILTGAEIPSFKEDELILPTSKLNNSQQIAVQKVCTADDLAIVHGPPGTGKTTTLVQAIKVLVNQGVSPILVVAPSNTAVDLLTQRLSEEEIDVVRVGNPARVSDELLAKTLDSRLAEHSAMKEIKKLRKQANEFRNMAHTYKRNFGKAERDQRKALFDEAHKILKEVSRLEQYGIDDILGKAQIITATLVGSNNYTIRNIKYQAVVIDEAGQALEPACWIPILKAPKLIMAGDFFQLPPTIKSTEAAQGGLATTLMEKCVVLYPDSVVLLEEQYRMNEAIMGYSSSVFYENRLKAHESVAQYRVLPEQEPLMYLDTAGCGFEEKLQGTSYTNPEEATFLFNHLTKLIADIRAVYPTDELPSIAVISPYRQQVFLMQELLSHAPELIAYGPGLSVNTIDSFQGQERDVVYISMTRSNDRGGIGFLSDIRRMNVAMTRARKKLVIVGDSATLGQFGFYSDFIEYAETKGAHHSAWEFMAD